MDLAALLTAGQGIVDRVIDTAGTTVTFRRDPDDTGNVTIDPDTLAVTDPDDPGQLLAADVPALVVAADTTRSRTTLAGPGREQPVGDYQIVLHADVTNIGAGAVGTVTASRDPLLVGQRMRITAVRNDSAGVARFLTAVRA